VEGLAATLCTMEVVLGGSRPSHHIGVDGRLERDESVTTQALEIIVPFDHLSSHFLLTWQTYKRVSREDICDRLRTLMSSFNLRSVDS